MGALPSRETQQRGLYSHRHGRNRRNEVILVPLTATFFPEPQCPVFRSLFDARHRCTAKYYYRDVRPASADPSTDYYCQTTKQTRHAEPNGADDAALFETHFSDSIEGLYHKLVRETELCMCETDEELRERYLAQLRQQQQQKQQQQQRNNNNNNNNSSYSGGNDSVGDVFSYAAGFADAMAYEKGKAQHTYRNNGGTHITSPAAYHLRPVPCAIVSRFDLSRPGTGQSVDFLGFNVKVLGMFGLFPTTLPLSFGGEAENGGNTNQTDTENATVLSHLLKATMFIDRDVGDQILGNVVMLATQMYVRQCMEAKLRAPFIPITPFIFRTPISNVPMLQFVREMRVRLRALLEAGTAASGTQPLHAGLSNAVDALSHEVQQLRQELDAYLFEDDVPSATDPKQLFSEEEESIWLQSSTATQNTNPSGVLPILMISGVNVQSTPINHSSLSSVAHVRIPAWAAESDKITNNYQKNNPNTNGVQVLESSIDDSLNDSVLAQGSESSRAALLLARRRGRFRIWVEGGKLCVWVSAAYARRGCLILAQQLAFSVDNNAIPTPRAWNYCGLLRGGTCIPAPAHINDVCIVARDMPAMGLYQGDMLRCCNVREAAIAAGRSAQTPTRSPTTATAPITTATTTTTTATATTTIATNTSVPAVSSSLTSPLLLSPGAERNFTSNHSSNPLLQPLGDAPPGAFWVPLSGEQSAAAPAGSSRRGSGDSGYRHVYVEDVLLAWIKAIAIQTRDAEESHPAWVLDPRTGDPAHINRYVIWRVEHDGMRYFMGVAPRFLGQQRKAERERSRGEKGQSGEEGEESESENPIAAGEGGTEKP